MEPWIPAFAGMTIRANHELKSAALGKGGVALQGPHLLAFSCPAPGFPAGRSSTAYENDNAPKWPPLQGFQPDASNEYGNNPPRAVPGSRDPSPSQGTSRKGSFRAPAGNLARRRTMHFRGFSFRCSRLFVRWNRWNWRRGQGNRLRLRRQPNGRVPERSNRRKYGRGNSHTIGLVFQRMIGDPVAQRPGALTTECSAFADPGPHPPHSLELTSMREVASVYD